ncbi:MAG: signal peptidase I [Candidatus Acidiferrum sp.]|jgi:signal peptidase I
MPELNLGLKPPPTQSTRSPNLFLRVLICAGILLALLVFFHVAKFFLWAKSSNLHALRVGGDSMCPAICMGERIIAGLDAFDVRSPERGEVILFNNGASNSKFVKRVIAVGGDTVSPGPNGTVIVNGSEVRFPEPCGTSERANYRDTISLTFEPQKLPEGTFYVIGDNLNNSYDSRHFGLVRRDQVRGKALLIYWSSSLSRIGCRIK